MKQKEVLFLGKKNDLNTINAARYLKNNFSNVLCYYGEWGDSFPQDLGYWSGDLIISYLSRWKVPKILIDKTPMCINFHPGTNEYPGIGCLNFALYNEASTYGVCCHHIEEEIDSGQIIAVDHFTVLASDTVESLLAKTYTYQLAQFYRLVDLLVSNKNLPVSDLEWTRKPYRRTEFEKLKLISPSMKPEEIRKRVRATSYGEFQPKVTLGKHTFIYKE